MGTVVKISQTKPQILVASYLCESCGYEVFQTVHTKTFNPLLVCPSPSCKANNQRGELSLNCRACRYSDFQEVKIQELNEEVPPGHVPRTICCAL